MMINMDESVTCPKCGKILSSGYKFCNVCGAPIREMDVPISLKIKPRLGKDSVRGSFQEKLKTIGTRVQQAVPSEKTQDVLERAKSLKQKATGVINPERAAEVISELVTIMLNVAKQLHTEMPEEMLKAVDLEASVNFVAFNLGISIDLEQIPRETASTQLDARAVS